MAAENLRRRAPSPKAVLAVLLLLAASLCAAGQPPSPAVQAPAPFPLTINGRPLHYTINFQPVMPGEEVVFTSADHLLPRLNIQVADRALELTRQQWVWRAPERAGVYTAVVHLEAAGAQNQRQTLEVQLLVMVPANRVSNGHLKGYRIGGYPPPLRELSSYNAPEGFIEVTANTQHTPVSPNFTLGQFLCKQKSGYPKYLVLQPALVNKLEELLLEVNARGIITPSFVIMSGYRTPYYNRAIKNVPSSYHIYGGAADIYIDVNPEDGVMDDLNRDGKLDRRDAALLYDWADSFAARHNRPDLTGGVGEYDSTHAHGPFIHIDVRGTPARWGRWPP